MRHLRRRLGAAPWATISTRSYPAQLISVSRSLPSPPVIVLACDHLAVTGYSGCSMVSIAAVLARLVASPLIAFWVAARRCRRCGGYSGRGGWRGGHGGRGGWCGSHGGRGGWRGGNLRSTLEDATGVTEESEQDAKNIVAEKATPIIVNERIKLSGREISMCCFYVRITARRGSRRISSNSDTKAAWRARSVTVNQ